MGKKLSQQACARYRVIAHRGFHNATVSENSLGAFRLAMENNLPFEFDVHLSKDGRLIVCHDSDLERVTGKPGLIPNLTLKEIKENYRLKDGQEVPTIEEVFELNKETSPIVLELKVDDGNDEAISKAALEALSNIKDKEKVTIISFYPKALKKCKGNGFSTGLLISQNHPNIKYLSPLFDYLDIDWELLKDPYYQKYRRKGGKINVWTVEKEETLEVIKGKVDMVTFQHLPIDIVKKAMEE